MAAAVGRDGLADVGSRDKRAYLVDPEERRITATLAGDAGPVQAVAFDGTGARVATGSTYGTVRVWDTHDQSQLAVLSGARGAVRQVAFSGDGSKVLAVAGNELDLWDVSTDPRVLRGHASYVYDLEFIRGGARLVSLSFDGKLCVWDSASFELLGEAGGPGSTPTTYALAAARDGDLLALARPNGVAILDGDTLQPLRTLELHRADVVRDVSFSPDGSVLAARSDQRIVLFDVESGALRGDWPASFSTPYGAVDFSHDRRRFAYSEGNQAVVRDAASGEVLARLEGHRASVEALAFAPDDTLLASGAVDRTVRLWDLSTWSARGVLEGHTDRVYSLAFSPDGKMLASGSNDTTIPPWSASTGEELALLTGHEDYVFSLAFDPDGSRLASASGDMTVRLWDTLPRSERWRAGERARAARRRTGTHAGATVGVRRSRGGRARRARRPRPRRGAWSAGGACRARPGARRPARAPGPRKGPRPPRPASRASIKRNQASWTSAVGCSVWPGLSSRGSPPAMRFSSSYRASRSC